MASSWINQENQTTAHLLPFGSLSYLKPSPKFSKVFLPFVAPQPPAPLASYMPISVVLWLVSAAWTLLLPSPTKYVCSRLPPSKYQLSSWMSKLVLIMSAPTSWLISSPKGGVSAYLVAWIKSFLSKRQCRLIFQGTPKVFCPVAVGTPQGSPFSPLLFVLYIASLYLTIPKDITISYIDNLTITVGLDSIRSNIHPLQHLFNLIQREGADLGVPVAVPKTELIH